MQSLKRQIDFYLFLRQTIQITVFQVYALTSNAEEAEVERFYEYLQVLELTPKEDDCFILGHWKFKSRK